MSAYTKGPWKLGYSAIISSNTDEDGDPIVIALPYGRKGQNRIRGLSEFSVVPANEAVANAKLIAAAPQMAEMLLRMVTLVLHGGPTLADAEALLRKAGVL